jgi:pantoate--beta-alanine ligase
MRTFEQISALRAFVRAARDEDKVVGLVPTMGALHDGHLSLIRKAKGECDIVVVSIFVNPIQFLPGEDFEKYPRDLAHDSRMCQEAGAEALFTPAVQEMYPHGPGAFVDIPDLAARWDGAARPGHFRGVATVCAKLFNIVSPQRAYFGQKDYQQLKIIQKMVSDLNMPVTVVPVPIMREPDGLAMSSRNAYLTPEERKAAPALFRALKKAESLYNEGERKGTLLQQVILGELEKEPLIKAEYSALADTESLEPTDEAGDHAVLLIAVRLGQTRLIDNILLGNTHSNGS